MRANTERRNIQNRQAELEAKGQTLSKEDQDRLSAIEDEISLGDYESQIREYESQPWKSIVDPAIQRRAQQSQFRYVINKFILVLTQARRERVAALRGQWPELRKLCVNGVDLLKVDLDEAQAAVVQAGLSNRLDLMNVRGQVVDAWRQLAVFANALLGTFNVQYSLSSTTPAGLAQPLNFSSSGTTNQLILNTQLPIVRKSERNSYRASLINYQRARRILQRAEDEVMFDVRGEVRQLRQQADSYAIQQRLVELSYMTVENALDTFLAPPQPVAAGQQAVDSATRAASLTNQLITAQTTLYNAQFAMTTIWITYLNTRLQLYRDMELMQLDENGAWIDDVGTCRCPPEETATPADGKTPVEKLSIEPKPVPMAGSVPKLLPVIKP
jgi:hypothetical protein